MTDPQQRLADLVSVLPGITQTPAALLLCILDAPARIHTYDALSGGIRDLLGGDYPSTLALQTMVKHSRRAVRAADWPVVITTHHALGLRAVITQAGWQVPWPIPTQLAGEQTANDLAAVRGARMSRQELAGTLRKAGYTCSATFAADAFRAVLIAIRDGRMAEPLSGDW